MLELIQQNPIWQSLGIIAMLIICFWMSRKDDRQSKLIIMSSMVVWIIHFIYMGIYSWAVWSAVALLRIFLSVRFQWSKPAFIFIILLTLLLWMLTYDNIYDILPIFWSVVAAIGFFFFEKLKLRLFMLVTSIFRFSFSVWNGLIGWIMNELIVQIILLVAMYKMVHDEWKRVFMIDTVLETFHKPKADVGRFIAVYDYIHMKHKSLKLWILRKIRK